MLLIMMIVVTLVLMVLMVMKVMMMVMVLVMMMMMMMMVSFLKGWGMMRYDECINALLHLRFTVARVRVQVQGLDPGICDLGCQQSLTRAVPDLYTLNHSHP